MKKEDIKPGPTRFDQLPADVLATSTTGRVNYSLVPADKGLHALLKPFVSKDADTRRVALTELFFDKQHGQIVVSDGYRLVMLPGSFKQSGNFKLDGRASTERFPDYPNAIPLGTKSTVCSVSCRPLRSYLQAAKLFVNQTTYYIPFHVAGDQWAAFDAKMLLQLLTFFERLGHPVIQMAFQAANRGVIFSAGPYNGLGKQATVLQMPRMLWDEDEPVKKGRVYWPTDFDAHTELQAYWSFSADTVILEDGRPATFNNATHTWNWSAPKPAPALSDQQFLLLRAQALLLILRLRLRLTA